ncbi:MAG: SDR family NAD(P)-dependent oxidoreductase [Robiginitomaculum sp.]|nr:SDR family NAD(P)-dependent oxidoreductase [Robiginitomaculum sp.]
MTDKTDNRPLAGRVTLVTGASRGIGYAAAIELAKAGSHIIATARTQGGLEDLDDAIRALAKKEKGIGEATIVPMDLKHPDGIDQLGKAVYERWGRLDGLLANAGLLGEIAPVPHITPKKFDETIAVNVTANFRLIRSFDQLLRDAPSGRAVFMSSSSAQSRKAFWGVYAASKSALDAMVQSWAEETEITNLRVNLVYPGPVRTQMRAKAMPGEDPDILPTPSDIAKRIVPLLAPEYQAHGEIINFRD